VVLHGRVLNVSDFLSQHPGGELAILTFAGKDATAEFDMIHPPDVIEKYAPDAVIGLLGTGDATGASPIGDAPAAAQVAVAGVGGARTKDYAKANKNRSARMDGYGKVSIPIIGPFIYMVIGFMKEIIFTIFGQKNIVLTNDRVGLSRSAIFLFVFVIIHAVGNLHVFLGPRDFNGYGYFYARLYWTGFGLQANIVEEYVLLSALLHVAVALKRTWDISLNYSVASGKLNMAISGVTLLTFMTIHLFQFRFGDTQPYQLCAPEYLVNIWPGVKRLGFFWVDEPNCATVPVRDIYRLEFEVFKSLGWVLFYIGAVCVFTTHMCLGWAKVVGAPALGIPKRYQNKAAHIGYVMTIGVALIYVSFPIYTHMWPISGPSESSLL